MSKNIYEYLPTHVRLKLCELVAATKLRGIEYGLLIHGLPEKPLTIHTSEIFVGDQNSVYIDTSVCTKDPCLAYFHTHPNGITVFSPEDIAFYCTICITSDYRFKTHYSIILGAPDERGDVYWIKYFTLKKTTPEYRDRFCREYWSLKKESKDVIELVKEANMLVTEYFTEVLASYSLTCREIDVYKFSSAKEPSLEDIMKLAELIEQGFERLHI